MFFVCFFVVVFSRKGHVKFSFIFYVQQAATQVIKIWRLNTVGASENPSTNSQAHDTYGFIVFTNVCLKMLLPVEM